MRTRGTSHAKESPQLQGSRTEEPSRDLSLCLSVSPSFAFRGHFSPHAVRGEDTVHGSVASLHVQDQSTQPETAS